MKNAAAEATFGSTQEHVVMLGSDLDSAGKEAPHSIPLAGTQLMPEQSLSVREAVTVMDDGYHLRFDGCGGRGNAGK